MDDTVLLMGGSYTEISDIKFSHKGFLFRAESILRWKPDNSNGFFYAGYIRIKKDDGDDDFKSFMLMAKNKSDLVKEIKKNFNTLSFVTFFKF
jgi:hypothetical protein